MKLFTLAVFALLLATSAAFAAPERLNEGRCFDIKQSVLADLPHFCGSAKTDKARLADFGHQIELLDKKCDQPQLAHLFRKALDARVNKGSASGCTAATEKAVLPAKKSKARASASDVTL